MGAERIVTIHRYPTRAEAIDTLSRVMHLSGMDAVTMDNLADIIYCLQAERKLLDVWGVAYENARKAAVSERKRDPYRMTPRKNAFKKTMDGLEENPEDGRWEVKTNVGP